jgi:RNA polymerase sigma-70 factor (ECF subfamily)
MTQRREPQLDASRERQFRLLYEDHVEQVARYVARRTAAHDVQDVVAETFLTAWRRLDDLPGDAVPWLFVTARNVMANRHRSSERRRALENKLASASPWLPGAPVTSDLSEIDQRLLEAIAELPEAEREAFMLIAWDGLDPARAARAAGCSAPAFRMRLHRARRRLKEQIGPHRPFVPLTEIPSLKETR